MSQLDSMSHDDLIQLVKNQIVVKKKLDAKISELTSCNVRLCQTEDVIISFEKFYFHYLNIFLATT